MEAGVAANKSQILFKFHPKVLEAVEELADQYVALKKREDGNPQKKRWPAESSASYNANSILHDETIQQFIENKNTIFTKYQESIQNCEQTIAKHHPEMLSAEQRSLFEVKSTKTPLMHRARKDAWNQLEQLVNDRVKERAKEFPEAEIPQPSSIFGSNKSNRL